MALKQAKTMIGISLPEAYARISQLQVVFWPLPRTVNVHVNIYSSKASFDAGDRPLAVRSITKKVSEVPNALKLAGVALRAELYNWPKGLIDGDDPDLEEWDGSGATDDQSD